MAYVVSSLPAYVQTNHDLLVKNFALVGPGTRSRMTIQTGVKKDAYINYLEVSPTLQDGSSCGFDAAGNATLTQRLIETAMIKANMEFCEKTLLGKYAEYLVKVNAVDEPFPFEEYITTAITNELNKKIEKLIWQGDTSSASTDLKWIDGLEIAIQTDGTSIDVSAEAGNGIYAKLIAVYMGLSEDLLDKGVSIFVSPAIFRQFMQEMVVKNYFHYNPGQDEVNEFMLPATDCKIVRTQGLAGSTKVYATFDKNLIYGCDMQNDAERFDVWYSQDDRVWKVAIEWNSGVQIAFPALAFWAETDVEEDEGE